MSLRFTTIFSFDRLDAGWLDFTLGGVRFMASHMSDFPLDLCQGTIRLLDGAEHVRIAFTDEHTGFQIRLQEHSDMVTVSVEERLKSRCTVKEWAQSVFDFLSAMRDAHPGNDYKRAWMGPDFPWDSFGALCEKMDR
jgi:hypothetical protein